MIDPKIAGICAASAFGLSFLLGMINHSSFTVSIFKGIIFAGVFFGLAAGIEVVYKKFLLKVNGEAGGNEGLDDVLGRNVDINVGDDEDGEGGVNDGVAELEELEEIEELEELDDVEELPEAEALDEGLDQSKKKVYPNIGSTISEKIDDDDSGLNIASFVTHDLETSEEAFEKNAQAQSNRTVTNKTEFKTDSGVVEMSMEKFGSGGVKNSSGVDFKVDGKKAAGAIQTLLSKDEE